MPCSWCADWVLSAPLLAPAPEPQPLNPQLCSATLRKLRDKFNKRLSTTVEEENSNRDHFEEVQRREEKAGKEKLSLEQQLGLEKKERRRQMQVGARAEGAESLPGRAQRCARGRRRADAAGHPPKSRS